MVFIIKPISAQLTEDHDLVGKSDPYCVIHIGGQKFQTKPHKGAGLNPKWDETFSFKGDATELKIQVFDEDVGSDDSYGTGNLGLLKWLSNPSKSQTDVIEIFHKEKKTGQVLINIEYQGPANKGVFSSPSSLGY